MPKKKGKEKEAEKKPSSPPILKEMTDDQWDYIQHGWPALVKPRLKAA